MAEFNKCSKLVENLADAKAKYKELTNIGLDPFVEMYDMQYELQKELHNKLPKYNPDPKKLETIGEIYDYIRESKQAFDDEFRELVDALSGMSKPEKERSAIWKRWKSQHDEIRNIKLSDLSEDDLLELKFEATDLFFFYLNIMLALKIHPTELFELYYLKNAENFKRYKSKY